MKKAVGYIRRSTDKQEHSLEDQRKAIEEYAINSGIELLRFYEDDAISGTSTNGRAGFNGMIALGNFLLIVPVLGTMLWKRRF